MMKNESNVLSTSLGPVTMGHAELTNYGDASKARVGRPLSPLQSLCRWSVVGMMLLGRMLPADVRIQMHGML